MFDSPKFICDDHCGRLARWLRFLWYDCLYERDIPNNILLKIAARDDRVILSRDSKLTEKALARTVVIIDSPSPITQLRQVIARFQLVIDRDRIGTRCSVCNGDAKPAEMVDIAERVPPYVRQAQTSFRECAQCRRIYWHGTHVKNMIRKLILDGILD